jgi:taurine dioxygenase
MQQIAKLSDAQGFELIDELYAHASQPRYEYRHRWQLGDLVIWDNRSVMHQANADYNPEERRYLYRLMVQGVPLEPFK